MIAALLTLSLAASSAAAGQTDSLVAAAQRAAASWRRHDFAALVGGGGDIAVQLPGSNPSAPLRPAQAAELLRAFSAGADELEVEVEVARNVDGERGYVEIRRIFVIRGTTARRAQTVYVGLHRSGASYRVVEVRVVP